MIAAHQRRDPDQDARRADRQRSSPCTPTRISSSLPRSGTVRAARLPRSGTAEPVSPPESLACLAGDAPSTHRSGKSQIHVEDSVGPQTKQLRDAVCDFAGDGHRNPGPPTATTAPRPSLTTRVHPGPRLALRHLALLQDPAPTTCHRPPGTAQPDPRPGGGTGLLIGLAGGRHQRTITSPFKHYCGRYRERDPLPELVIGGGCVERVHTSRRSPVGPSHGTAGGGTSARQIPRAQVGPRCREQ